MRAKTKGVSEVVASLALIAVTLAAMAIYIQGFNMYYSGETGLLSGAFRSGSEQNYERISIIYAYQDSNYLNIIVYNYGARNATIDRLIIDTNVKNPAPQAINANSLGIIKTDKLNNPSPTAHAISIITERNNVVSTQFWA